MLSVLGGAVLVKSRPEEEQVRSQLEAAYARLNQAMQQEGPPTQLQEALRDLLAPGELRQEMLAGVDNTVLAGGDKTLKRTLAHTIRIQKLVVKGTKAVATVQQTADVIRIDEDARYGTQGKEHRIQVTILYQDTWVKIKEKWFLSATQAGETILLVDGTLVDL